MNSLSIAWKSWPGYVGIPIVDELSEHVDAIGFDANEHKTCECRDSFDSMFEVGKEVSTNKAFDCTSDEM